MHAHACDMCNGAGEKVIHDMAPELWPCDWWINDNGLCTAECWDCRGSGVVECDDVECVVEWPDADLEVA